MKIGTKSVLFGAHCFFLHPFFVAAAWWKLYGFPWQPWLWLAFFVHDIGYLGKPNMDGPEGEQHPWTGARILYLLQGGWLFLCRHAWKSNPRLKYPIRWWQLRRKWASAQIAIAQEKEIWGNEALYHSRFLSKQYGRQPSRLCWADKLAFNLTPLWLYLPMVRLTGEIREYKAISKHRQDTGHESQASTWADDRTWALNLRRRINDLIAENVQATPLRR